MTTPKASGPLWACQYSNDVLEFNDLLPADGTYRGPGYSEPCRLIPGHGRVVPVELVEAIRGIAESLGVPFYEPEDAEPIGWLSLSAAIRDAIRGAI